MSALATLATYLPRLAAPTFTQGAVNLGTLFGGLEIWTHENTHSPFLDGLDQWSDYPTAVIAAAVSYSTFKTNAWNHVGAGFILFAPLVAKVIKHLTVGTEIETWADSTRRYLTDEEKAHNKRAHTIITLSDSFYRLLVTGCKIALIAFAIQFTWADLTTPGVPLTQLVASALSAACLTQAAISQYKKPV